MNPRLFLSLSGLFLACRPAAAAATAQDPPPAPAPQNEGYAPSNSQLRFGKDTVDLGDVYQENDYDVEFPFEIEGTDPVLVTAIETSCGCTDAYFELKGVKTPILPGQPLAIPADVRSGVIKARFSSQQFHNRKISTLTLRGNGVGMPQKLTISAFIRAIFELSPQRVAFGEILYRKGGMPLTEEETAARAKQVLVAAPQAFTVTRWAYLPPGIQVVDTGKAETGPDGKSQTRCFEIRVTADAPPGRLTSSILAETSLNKTLEIIVIGEILGPVRYYPGERILFGMVNQGQAPTRRLKVVVGGPGMILPEPKVELIGEGPLKAEIVDRQADVQYEIKIDLAPDAPVGRHSAVLRLSYPAESGIEPKEFPVTAVVRQPQ